MIAALFVETGGCYFGLEGVDPWDRERDARRYEGPHPVVAHPPCQLWVNFAALNYKRWGGEHNKPAWWFGIKSDGGCFVSALLSVRAYGGVLEHPAGSHAFAACEIPQPRGLGWQKTLQPDEYVCEVWQSSYGHRARKRTWLFYVGLPPAELRWNARPGDMQIGKFDRNKPTLVGKAASATPPAFRDELLNLARHSRGERRAA